MLTPISMKTTTRRTDVPREVKWVGQVIFVCFVCLCASCGGNENILQSGKETPAPISSSPKDPVEKELGSMRTAGFQFIYVVKRKDAAKMTADDRGLIKLQTADTNRRVATDDERAIVIGSNTQIPPTNLATLYQHFSIDNYSQAPAADNVNANTNK